ncbi:MAG: phytanoyl-CoA dioxygenase family protein [Pseudomonadota bacterium]
MCEADQFDVGAIMGGLYGDGYIVRRGAFSHDWVVRLGQDIDQLFNEARARPGGALERGPHRYYVEIHPERLRGFADLLGHPWVVAVCRAVLGPDYKIVEVGFDVAQPGAMKQPWHRDFPAPSRTVTGRRLDSLAFNLSTVDVTEEMGPLEIAPGTQWDTWEGDQPMFPGQTLAARYEARRQRKLARMGDISARSALTIHRGSANVSSQARPVLVLGADAPDGCNADKHDLQLSRAYYAGLAPELRRHVACRVLDRLEPIRQAHTIAGLLMGAPD